MFKDSGDPQGRLDFIEAIILGALGKTGNSIEGAIKRIQAAKDLKEKERETGGDANDIDTHVSFYSDAIKELEKRLPPSPPSES